MISLWRSDRELFWDFFEVSAASPDLLEEMWESEWRDICQEIRLAPPGHWARRKVAMREVFLRGLWRGKRTLPEAYEEFFPEAIDEFWLRSLPRLEGSCPRELLRRWIAQADAFGVEEEWRDVFAALGAYSVDESSRIV